MKYTDVSQDWIIFTGINSSNFDERILIKRRILWSLILILIYFFEKMHSYGVVNWWNVMKFMNIAQDWIIIFTGITCVEFIQLQWKYVPSNENFMIFNFDFDVFKKKNVHGKNRKKTYFVKPRTLVAKMFTFCFLSQLCDYSALWQMYCPNSSFLKFKVESTIPI